MGRGRSAFTPPYVAARDGDYRDAIAKKHPTHLLLVETTGALSPSLARIVERLAAQSREKGAIDHTAYGLERRSGPRSLPLTARRRYIGRHPAC